MDWSQSILFASFLDYSQNKASKGDFLANLGPCKTGAIYTDVELQYIISLIHKMQKNEAYKVEEREALIM